MSAVTSSELDVETLSSLICLTTPSALAARVRPLTIFAALRRVTRPTPTCMAWLQFVVTHSLNREWSWYVPHESKAGVATHIIALCPAMADSYASLGGDMRMPIDFFQREEVLADIYPDSPIPSGPPTWESHPAEVLLLSDELDFSWPHSDVTRICADNLALDKVPLCSSSVSAVAARLSKVREQISSHAWSFITESIRRDLAVNIINKIAIEVRKHGTESNSVADALTSSLVDILECCELATPYLDLLRKYGYRGLIVGHSATSIQRLYGLTVLGLPLPTKRRVEMVSKILEDPGSHRLNIAKCNSRKLRLLLDVKEEVSPVKRSRAKTAKTTKTRRGPKPAREAEVDYVPWDLIANSGRGGKVRLLPRDSSELSVKSKVNAAHYNAMAIQWNLGHPMPVLEMLEDMMMRLDEIVL